MVLDYAGLLVNKLPGESGLPFDESSDNFYSDFIRSRTGIPTNSTSRVSIVHGGKSEASEFS